MGAKLLSVRDTEEIEALMDEFPKRLLRFMNGAPRTWDELVGSMAGVSDPSRVEHALDKVQLIHISTQVLWEMVRAGRVVRTPASDPRYDLYGPAGR